MITEENRELHVVRFDTLYFFHGTTWGMLARTETTGFIPMLVNLRVDIKTAINPC